MSIKRLSIFLLLIFLLLLSSPAFAIRQLTASSKAPGDYTLLKPKEGNYGGGHGGGFGIRPEVESCLPKGIQRTSAPSRYVNYQTLGSDLCSSPTSSKNLNKPWKRSWNFDIWGPESLLHKLYSCSIYMSL